MMEKEKLRQADFVTSILLIGFGGWVISQALGMPMRESYGGVRNVWYVSPALLPLVVGAGILLLSVMLLVHSVKTGGAREFLVALRGMSRGISEANERFLAITVSIIALVYLLIPRVDFVLAVCLFLTYSVPAFYYDSAVALRRISRVYAGILAVLLIVFASGFGDVINAPFEFSTDVLVLAAIIGLTIYNRVRLVGNDDALRRKFRLGLAVALGTPLLLTPVFRFLLFVRLPHEGGIVQLMQLIWFSLR